jgi:hypothetical protein
VTRGAVRNANAPPIRAVAAAAWWLPCSRCRAGGLQQQSATQRWLPSLKTTDISGLCFVARAMFATWADLLGDRERRSRQAGGAFYVSQRWDLPAQARRLVGRRGALGRGRRRHPRQGKRTRPASGRRGAQQVFRLPSGKAGQVSNRRPHSAVRVG